MLRKKTLTIVEPLPSTIEDEAFSSFDKIFKLSGKPVSQNPQSLTFYLDIKNHRFYVKRYHTTKGIRSWLGMSRIRQEARNQLWFNRMGVPSARVVAFGEEHILSRTIRGFLITEYVKNTEDLAWTVKNRPLLFNNQKWVTQVINQIAEITRTIHQHNFCHNDLYWRNILVSQDIDLPQVYLIDCPLGQRFFGPFLRYRIIKDLACLDKVGKQILSRTRRLRFYKEYRQCHKLSKEDRKIVLKSLEYFKG